MSTGLLAVAPLARSEPVNQIFIGTDLLSALLPLVLLWLSVGPAAMGLGVAALIRRHQPGARWLGLFTGWLAVSGLALPLILLSLTGDGAIHSC